MTCAASIEKGSANNLETLILSCVRIDNAGDGI